jgi:hypothetical protein
MGEAWSINLAMFKDHGLAVGAVLLVSYVVIAALFFLLFADMSAMMFDSAQADPEAISAMMAGRTGLFGFIGLITFLLSIAAYLIAWRIVLSRGQDTIGGAIGYGLLAAFPALFAIIILYVAFIILFLIFGMIMAAVFGVALMGADSPGVGAGIGLAMVLFYIGLLVFVLFLFARLGTTGTFMAAERSYNPFRAMIESWKLTKNNSLMLMLYLFLISIAFFVIYFILTLVAGLLSNLSIALGVIVGAAVVLPLMVFYILVPASIYGTLIDNDPAVADVFR